MVAGAEVAAADRAFDRAAAAMLDATDRSRRHKSCLIPPGAVQITSFPPPPLAQHRAGPWGAPSAEHAAAEGAGARMSGRQRRRSLELDQVRLGCPGGRAFRSCLRLPARRPLRLPPHLSVHLRRTADSPGWRTPPRPHKPAGRHCRRRPGAEQRRRLAQAPGGSKGP